MARRLAAGGRALLRHLHRLQRGGRPQAGPAPSGLPSIVTMANDTGQRYFTTPLCGEAKHVEVPEREHPMDERTRRELDRHQAALGDPRVKPSEYDFVAARRRLEAKPKSAGEKLTTIEDAVARVRDGDHVAVGGCLFSRTPMALVREILRQRRRGLTLSRNLMCTEGEFLMVAGRRRARGYRLDVHRPALGRVEDPPPLRGVGQGRARGVEPPRPRPALPGGRHGRALPARAHHAGLGPDGRERDEDDRGSLHGADAWPRCPPSFPTWRSCTCTGPTDSATPRSTATPTWTPTSPGPPPQC